MQHKAPLNSLPSLPPAQLWIGNHEELLERTISLMQKTFCRQAGCTACIICGAIRNQQYHGITWLLPEKTYTLDHLSVITKTLPLALEPDEHHFFIIQQAEALSPACSNSLLKSIEEPPRGYHFLLLTHRPDEIIPTIQSRCIVSTWHSEKQPIKHQPLFDIFTYKTKQTPAAFLKTLEQSKINERESIELLDQLLLHWIKISKASLLNHDEQSYKKSQTIINLLHRALLNPPMPGSSNLLWKNLILLMPS